MFSNKKILIAPNAFKGTLTANEVAESISNAVHENSQPQSLKILPLADGGDGTLRVLTAALNLEITECQTVDPLGREINALYGIKDGAAYFELAEASGIQHLRKEELDPSIANTFGTGLLILDAIKQGIKDIRLFCGGSASVDLGFGIIAALAGIQKYSKTNPIFSFQSILTEAHHLRNKYSDISFSIYTDVNNKLLGENGSINVFGRQKGIKEEEIERYEKTFTQIATALNYEDDISGMGASGGLPFAFYQIFNVIPVLATKEIFKLLNLRQEIRESDMVITGEGSFDEQSIQGKLTGEIWKECVINSKDLIIVSAIDGHYKLEGAEVVILRSYLEDQERDKMNYIDQLSTALRRYIQKNTPY
ncbi:glycerate kinase [Marinigracilibium pacificum]|uniref:Glycerate kinase n=1 Tax=Marinigracilibium pacificum TaxID=2729599 RepID=A0A848IV92_9BACT|nr:glycerate kinase [Marinigracilibium pacificum]NMM47108.1 glycerate kinase [Marinigracilibium pacificum]